MPKLLDTNAYSNEDMPAKAAAKIEQAQQKILADLVAKTPAPSWATGLSPMLYLGGVGYTDPKTGSAYDPAGNLVYEVPKIRSGMDDLPIIMSMVATMFPPIAPFVQAYNAVKAIDEGNVLKFILNATGAGAKIPGLDANTAKLLSDVSTGAKIVQAVQSKDPLKIFSSVVNLPGVDPDLKDLSIVVNTAKAVSDGNIAGAFNGISKMSDRDSIKNLTDRFNDIVGGQDVAKLDPSQVSALTPPTAEQIAQEQADREQAAREAARAAEPSGGLPSDTDTTTDSKLTLPPVTVTGPMGNNTITDSALPVSPNVGTTDTNTGVNGNNVRTDSSLPVNPNVGTTYSGLTLPPVTVTGTAGNNTVTDSALPVNPNVGTTDYALNRVEVSGKRLPPEPTDLTLPPVEIRQPALPTTVAPKVPTIPKIPTIPKAPATPAPTAAAPTVAAPTGALPTTTEASAPAENVLKLGKMGSSEMGYNEHLKQLTLPERKELAMQADTAPSNVDLNKALAALAAYAPDAEKDVTPQIYADGGTVQRFADGGSPDVQAMIDSYSKADLQSALKNLGNIDTGLDQPEGQMFSLKQVGAPSKPQSLQQMHVIPQLAALLQSRGMRLAEGGQPDHTHPHYDGTPLFRTGGLDSLGGKYVEGKGDGTSDDIAAMLANGEYVFSADVVSALGNGSNKAGAKELDHMVQAIRARARSAPPDKLPPDAKSPLEYLKSSKGKKHG